MTEKGSFWHRFNNDPASARSLKALGSGAIVSSGIISFYGGMVYERSGKFDVLALTAIFAGANALLGGVVLSESKNPIYNQEMDTPPLEERVVEPGQQGSDTVQ